MKNVACLKGRSTMEKNRAEPLGSTNSGASGAVVKYRVAREGFPVKMETEQRPEGSKTAT